MVPQPVPRHGDSREDIRGGPRSVREEKQATNLKNLSNKGFIAMESRPNTKNSRDMAKLEHKIVQNRLANSRPKAHQQAPDLTDFMNDMFFGTVNNNKKTYNLTGDEDDEEEEFDRSNRSRSGQLTEEWLDEARRLVASSPSRSNSPARRVGSPRFAAASGRSDPASIIDRRDPQSRSARRQRAVDNFSGEILSKVVRHSRNKSESFSTAAAEEEEEPLNPASAVQKWISNIIKPSGSDPPISDLPPTPRKSRFHTDLPPSRLPFPPPDPLLSPPKTLTDPPPRRTVSSPACSIQTIKPKSNLNGFSRGDSGDLEFGLNGFLKVQRSKIQQISNGEQLHVKVKIILSGPSNSTSSMVAAVCYAWLLENKMRQSIAESGRESLVVPVMNMQRGSMWNQRQVAWLFYHLGLDASSILFTDEVDLESLMMAGRTSILVIGQDVFKMSDGVGSQCTILTDNYCEDAYHLLQTPLLKNLLLAGILLDTKNLDASSQSSMTRDAEAVQLLSVGSAPNYRNGLYDQLMRVQKERPFLDALQLSYGKPPNDGSNNGAGRAERITERNQTSISPHNDAINQQKKFNDFGTAKTCRVSPKSAKPSSLPIQTPAREAPNTSRGKNKNFLAKWFGFGSK